MIYNFTPSKYHYSFGPHTPVLKIKSGDTLITTTVDAGGYDSNGIAIPVEMKQTNPDTEYYPANPLVGPFFVEDADLWAKRAYKAFYLRPAFFMHRLKKIRSWQDLSKAVSAALMLMRMRG